MRRFGAGSSETRTAEFKQVEVTGGLGKVDPGRRFDPIGTTAEVDSIEVDEKNVLFTEVQFEEWGEHRLGQRLAYQHVGALEVDLLEGLLGQRAAALGPTGHRREQCPGESLGVDAEVLAEAAVFAGDKSVDEMGR